jgi:hypothetical protein
MATKRNPGKYDCYENAEPDEPLFVLLASSRVSLLAMCAAFLGLLWHALFRRPSDPAKVSEAADCARGMRGWRATYRPE